MCFQFRWLMFDVCLIPNFIRRVWDLVAHSGVTASLPFSINWKIKCFQKNAAKGNMLLFALPKDKPSLSIDSRERDHEFSFNNAMTFHMTLERSDVWWFLKLLRSSGKDLKYWILLTSVEWGTMVCRTKNIFDKPRQSCFPNNVSSAWWAKHTEHNFFSTHTTTPQF